MLNFLRRFKRPCIYLDSASNNARRAFTKMSARIVNLSKNAQILWLRKDYEEYFDQLQAFQLINHFPNEGVLINKGKLASALKKYFSEDESSDLQLADFFQETYCLYKRDERDEFFKKMPTEDCKDNLWILKPTNSSKGRGIKIVWRLQQLKSQYQKQHQDKNYIIQRYITNPLLVNKCKSGIRIYWMICSIDPLMVLIYSKGTIKLNTLPFQLDNFDNPLIHLSNTYQQMQHDGYDDNANLKWDFEEFQQYLSEECRLPGDYFEKVIFKKITNILKHVVKAGHSSLQQVPQQGLCFAMYGADFVLDDEFNPYLMEIQKGPGLKFKDRIKKKLIVEMLSETINIALEFRESKLNDKPCAEFKSRKNYQWAIK